MKQITFFSFCLWAFFPVFGQTDPQSQAYGARSQGMGNIKVFLNDSWTFFNNVGGMDRLEQSQISTGVDQRFGIRELSTFSLASVIKKEFGSLGFGISRFGGTLFNQQLAGIGFSHTLGMMSMGAKVDWMQTQIEGFGTGHALLFSLGGIAQLGPDFYLGAHFSNLNQAKISKNSSESLPTLVQLGFAYFPSASLSLYSELEKDVDLPPVFKAGIEYSLSERLYLRTGVNSHPTRLSFGLGLRQKHFHFDYGYGQNTALGRTHHFSIGFQF